MISQKHSPLFYLPPVSWFANHIFCDEIYFDIGLQYRKNLKLNRCSIAGANGIILLSIPLEKGRQQHGMIKDIRISYSRPWQKIHWNSIYSCYGKSSYFIYYADSLEKLFTTEMVSLTEWNLMLLQYCFDCLQLKKLLILNESVTESSPLCNKNISISFPRYPQVFESRHGFIPDLSILDLIFNLGPDAKKYLTASSVK